MRKTFLASVLALPLLSSLPAGAWPTGDTTGIAIQFQGMTRHYNVHVPASYDGSTPVPLVLDFHGWMSSPSDQEGLSGFSTLSETAGFIVAYPEGYEGTGTERSWNAGTCCNPALADSVDDVGFARAVVADVESQAKIDPQRVYTTGLSNGGAMSHRLACEAGDVFAAASSVACPLLIDPFSDCQPIRPMPILHFAGLTDQVVPYNGGESQIFPGIFLPSSPDSFAYWVGTDGCGSGPPEIIEDLGNGASCDTHTTCSASVEVGFCSIHGTLFYGHILYENSDNVNVAQRAWAFMSQFTLPPGITSPCPPALTTGCQAASSHKAVLKLIKGTTPDKDKLGWKWVSSGTVVAGDFGDPTATTSYALCVYDQTGLVLTATVPAGGTCAGRPCWTLSTGGARYANKSLVPDGLLKVSLKAGAPGQAKSAVTGKGANLPAPALPLTPAVRVQLRRQDTGGCWDATYTSALANTATAFKAKSD